MGAMSHSLHHCRFTAPAAAPGMVYYYRVAVEIG
jgi:hypothetical protein